MSVPAKVAAVIAVAGGVAFTFVVFVLDFFRENPSSTAPIIFPVMAVYIAIAVGLIALLDWGIRQIVRK